MEVGGTNAKFLELFFCVEAAGLVPTVNTASGPKQNWFSQSYSYQRWVGMVIPCIIDLFWVTSLRQNYGMILIYKSALKGNTDYTIKTIDVSLSYFVERICHTSKVILAVWKCHKAWLGDSVEFSHDWWSHVIHMVTTVRICPCGEECLNIQSSPVLLSPSHQCYWWHIEQKPHHKWHTNLGMISNVGHVPKYITALVLV